MATLALEPKAVRERDMGDQESVNVRKGFSAHSLWAFESEDNPVGAQLHSIHPGPGFFSPRHKHQETLIRFLVSGTMNYGKEEHLPGDCTIVTDGVMYGPMQEGPGELPHMIQTVIASPTGLAPLLPETVTAVRANLMEKGEFRNGVFFPKDGNPQDGYEAVANEVHNGDVKYPPSLLKAPLTVRTTDLPWRRYAEGIEIKRVIGLFDTGPFVTLLRLKKGASLPAGTSEWQQARYVVEGNIHWNGEDYDGISMFYYPPNVEYPETVATQDDTILFIVQWTINDDPILSPPGGTVF